MSNDDSFTDSDEVFSLYSSKKVTDTFKAQLKKIAANHELNKPLSQLNATDCIKQGGNIKQKVLTNTEKQVIPETKKLVESVILTNDSVVETPVEVNDSFSEDSIEVITELTPKSTRRSERLRKKTNSTVQNSCNGSSAINLNKQSIRGRKKGPKGKNQQRKSVDEITLDDSPKQIENDDELNPEVTVKVIWKSVNLKKFQVRKFQKLSYLFELLSKEENISKDKIILTFNNVRISQNDTPDSLNLQVYHFLDGGVLSELSNLCQTPNAQKTDSDSDLVMLKFQGANKKIIKINLNKNEKLKIGMIKCSEQLEIPLDKIKFFFDGDLLEPNETPSSLGLENEEIIDIKISR